ncbi:uncharacterized protein [Anabrus simplex]|uniref:uncharacterized protein n=1 Tax=Anabrus simplex TaxID=316456 RepID=UPI0035A3AB21
MPKHLSAMDDDSDDDDDDDDDEENEDSYGRQAHVEPQEKGHIEIIEITEWPVAWGILKKRWIMRGKTKNGSVYEVDPETARLIEERLVEEKEEEEEEAGEQMKEGRGLRHGQKRREADNRRLNLDQFNIRPLKDFFVRKPRDDNERRHQR